MPGWREERERALLVIEGAQRPALRAAAADTLCELAAADAARAPELVPLLPRLLDDAQAEVRRAALELAALTLSPADALPLLAARLKDSAERVRVEAAGRLADQARPEIRSALTGALEDLALPVRFEAARGIAAVGHPAGLEVLVAALDDGDLRFRALAALAELGDARAAPAVRRLFNRLFLPPFDRTQAAGTLARLGDPEAAAYLLARTRKRWSVDRALAIELCGEIKAPGAWERLTELVLDRMDGCRGAAARGLGWLGDPRALPPLQALLEDPASDDDLRLDAAEGLMALRSPEAQALVRRSLERFTSPEARAELQALLTEHEAA